MKLLFENWRRYLNETMEERFDGGGPRSDRQETPEFDLGETFTTITIDNLIKGKYKDSQDKATILAFLNLFNEFEGLTDTFEIKSKLKTIRTMSGNSPDFSFLKNYDEPKDEEVLRAKEKAIILYLTPHRYPARAGSNPTKSLKDWHEHLKVVWSTPRTNAREHDRSEKIKAFYTDSPKSKQKDFVNPYNTTAYSDIPPTMKSRRTIPPTIRESKKR